MRYNRVLFLFSIFVLSSESLTSKRPTEKGSKFENQF